ncbi:MAG: T9SS type A sorting domain-containing protein [Bacteroidota bacterium]
MKTYLIIFCTFLFSVNPFFLLSQNVLVLDSLSSLDNVLTEISGFEYLNNTLIGHTDSGGENALYEINPVDGSVVRKVVISNASNVDWEDLTADATHIFIGDFGNNDGNRQDLKIYRISQQDFFSLDTVSAETLSISYAAQTNFSSMRFQTNYDAEAIVAVGDSLYLFSKNWGNLRSYVYSLPKVPGQYALDIRDSLEVQGLITGADYDPLMDRLSFCGYTFTEAFFIDILTPVFPELSQSELDKTQFPFSGAFQVESICHEDSSRLYLATEGNANIPAYLYSFFIDKASSIQTFNSPDFRVFPNPAQKVLSIETEESISSSLYSMDGALLLEGKGKKLEVNSLPPGYYFLKIELADNKWIDVRKILISN